MPVPSPRNKILPARGNYSDLLANLGSLGDGEICYALDQDKLYVREGSSLIDVSGSGGGGGAVDSVNGQTGTVVLDANDVGAPSDSEFSTLAGRVSANEVAQGNNIVKNNEQDGRLDDLETDVSNINTFSGDYNDLSNKPAIPSDLSDLDDVSAGSPSNGDVLSYNGSSWVNTAAPPADISGSSIGNLNDVDTSSPGHVPSNGDFLQWDQSMGHWMPGTAVEPGDLADVATSGSYNDLTNKPTIPPAYDDTALAARVTTNEGDIAQLQTDVGNIDTFSGDYNDLTNKPSIPANTSDLNNDSGFITAAEAPVQPGDVFSGNYNDLTNKPTIPPAFNGGEISSAITSPEETIGGSWNLSAGNFWTAGAITVPNPSNAVAGMSGLIRLTAAPSGWGTNIKHPGGSPETISNFPAVVPFYVQSSSVILLGKATQGIA